MKKSELKSIIMECIEEITMDEGVRRMKRVADSRAHRDPVLAPGAYTDFDTAVDKVQRRNKRGSDKYGPTKFANARLKGQKPVEESGPADRYRKTHGKIQDTGGDPLAYKSGLKDSSGKLKSRLSSQYRGSVPTKIVDTSVGQDHHFRVYGKNKRNPNNPTVWSNEKGTFSGHRTKQGSFSKMNRSAKFHSDRQKKEK